MARSKSSEPGGGTISVRVVDRLGDIPAADWDACANPRAQPEAASRTPSEITSEETYNPFVSHAFLNSLEASGTVAAKTGWLPQHLVVEDRGTDDSTDGGTDGGVIAAAMPCYLKNHSYGEYVFDHGWADAYERAGGHYYPKLQVSVPFTPVTGPRLLAQPGPDADRNRNALIAAAVELCKRHKASSVHWTFLPKHEWDLLGEVGALQRTDRQFHWANEGYADFEEFLAALSSRKRKAIRRERREALSEGIEIVRLSGSDITEDHWDAFFAFYMDTGGRKWGRPYLNRAFFSEIGASMAERIVLVMARRAGRWIAGALNFAGDTTLYGRHWGCVEDHPFLHFEVCYYQAIEHAIDNRMAFVEAGAQGEHKLSRGYLPVTTYSAHYIADAGLRDAIADYLDRERHYVDAEARLLRDHAPFKKDSQ
ncbi:GNAT family N-acetyltransferase [Microbaculum marinisediminis]|uniref:GNAT family N-acetyltransferase n=1 Tax=Microbaculum marinisediminis TaxID=2931392 RepID=A0AAW5R3E3_9HYPH|nr:GNAT family N-acetyltransferase [Microbaculum sp. A6E488]MCT8973168.1 GNAT family N-acetyltransferase [Microbaculum sp. A6E488]